MALFRRYEHKSVKGSVSEYQNQNQMEQTIFQKKNVLDSCLIIINTLEKKIKKRIWKLRNRTCINFLKERKDYAIFKS